MLVHLFCPGIFLVGNYLNADLISLLVIGLLHVQLIYICFVNGQLIGFRCPALEYATLACRLFRAEDYQGPIDLRKPFNLSVDCLKRIQKRS